MTMSANLCFFFSFFSFTFAFERIPKQCRIIKDILRMSGRSVCTS